MRQPRRGLQFFDAGVSRTRRGTSKHLSEDPFEAVGGQDAVLLETVDPELPDRSSESDDLRIDPDFFEDLEQSR